MTQATQSEPTVATVLHLPESLNAWLHAEARKRGRTPRPYIISLLAEIKAAADKPDPALEAAGK